MSKRKPRPLFGREATAFLADQVRSKRPRQPRPVESFPGMLRDWMMEGAKKGEVVLEFASEAPSITHTVLEFRRMLRAFIDQKHELSSVAASVMILPPKEGRVRIVRRDYAYKNIQATVVEHDIPLPMGSVGKPDPMDAIFAEVREKDARDERIRYLKALDEEAWAKQRAEKAAAEDDPLAGLGEASHE